MVPARKDGTVALILIFIEDGGEHHAAQPPDHAEGTPDHAGTAHPPAHGDAAEDHFDQISQKGGNDEEPHEFMKTAALGKDFGTVLFS